MGEECLLLVSSWFFDVSSADAAHEVRVVGGIATNTGSNAALLAAVTGKKEGTDKVPSFVHEWRARQDSNPRPLGS
jgi:hypothetical protein